MRKPFSDRRQLSPAARIPLPCDSSVATGEKAQTDIQGCARNRQAQTAVGDQPRQHAAGNLKHCRNPRTAIKNKE